jgi:hypothetical protein
MYRTSISEASELALHRLQHDLARLLSLAEDVPGTGSSCSSLHRSRSSLFEPTIGQRGSVCSDESVPGSLIYQEESLGDAEVDERHDGSVDNDGDAQNP